MHVSHPSTAPTPSVTPHSPSPHELTLTSIGASGSGLDRLQWSRLDHAQCWASWADILGPQC
ncbi:hypothetical protein PanWU01x14_309240 [Parasponia andersonii]|uniref:Uncharacterized protein n=1 Tax=Parasponia andersonii TaxID=3476 RepID=A0A2P5AQS1_PARAD|nr:hypothetical protein PanWU01x14_309240 [Parasponia andersonii]